MIKFHSTTLDYFSAGVGWASVTDIGRLRPLLKDDWVSINGRSPDHVSSPSGLEEAVRVTIGPEEV